MSTTPQLGITLAPEGVLDPGAAMNLALEELDALASAGVVAVADMDRTSPPAEPVNGQQHVVAGADATGAWAGLENRLVRYVADGAFWQDFEPGTRFRMVLDQSDGSLYRWTGAAYVGVGGGGGGGSSTATVVTLGGTAYGLHELTSNGWHVFTADDPVVITILDNSEQAIAAGAEFGLEARGAGGVTLLVDGDAVVIPPKDGTIELEQGDFAVLKRTATDVYKLVGSTVAQESSS
jgi:hypothetical protein